jgi:UDP-glucose 4-epimerase
MANILVTGGAGYIGSHTTKLLLADGHKVVVLDTLELGHKKALDLLPRTTLIQADLGEKDVVLQGIKEHKIDAVIHFGAYASVPDSVADPVKYYHNNIISGIKLLDAVKESGVKHLIFSSSAATFGEPQYIPIDENHPQKPTNPYGQTKLDFEFILHWYDVAFGIKSIALRYFCAAGADPDGLLGEVHTPETHMIPLALFAALGRRPDIKIFGSDYPTEDGTGVRDYIHVTDLGTAHILALNALSAGAESNVYNLGNGIGYSVRQVIQTVKEVTGREFAATEAPRRPGDPARLVATSEKIQRELNWRPQYGDLKTMIKTAYDWFSTHPKGYDDK